MTHRDYDPTGIYLFTISPTHDAHYNRTSENEQHLFLIPTTIESGHYLCSKSKNRKESIMATRVERIAGIKEEIEQLENRRRRLILEQKKQGREGVMNCKTGIPLKSWKAERVKLTAERGMLNQEYISLKLKGEVKEAEQIRHGVYDIMQREARERQPHRTR